MTTSLAGTHAIVTGASRGFGRGIAQALIDAGADVVGVARDPRHLDLAAAELGPRFLPVQGDAADADLAAALLDKYRPHTVVLNAGAPPPSMPLQDHNWASFSRTWEVDVQHVFHWSRQALLQPLPPGSTVIAFSSGASIHGSPLSGGYAGAKTAVRFITSYAAEESVRAGLGIRFTCVLPRLTPATDLGAMAVAAYADRAGKDVPTFLAQFGPTPTPQSIAAQIVTLASDGTYDRPAYVLPATGGIVPLSAPG